jgi:ketosteroid isomerase-like protein
MTTQHPIVDRYVNAVNSGDPAEIVSLFVDDAVLTNPVGTFQGTDAIGRFYRDVVVAGKAVVAAGAVLADGLLVMAEIRGASPLDDFASTAYAVDVFRLSSDGRIQTLEIYYR